MVSRPVFLISLVDENYCFLTAGKETVLCSFDREDGLVLAPIETLLGRMRRQGGERGWAAVLDPLF